MDENELARRLSSLTTYWSEVKLAHQGTADEASAARRQLLERYLGAVYRYLLGAVRDPDVANALRFILAHAGEWIGVRELLLALPVQRRSL